MDKLIKVGLISGVIYLILLVLGVLFFASGVNAGIILVMLLAKLLTYFLVITIPITLIIKFIKYLLK